MAKSRTAVKTQPAVVMESEVARKIRQHARTSMKAEVCGVLIGNNENDRTVVEACIPGVNAAQGGAHVTFTQDTWEHIYKIKDREYPDEKIVGWYHSHPGFGVFLSEHDLFIQENFFSGPHQIAWVYDPHTDEEGCFGWVNAKVEKLSGIRFGYSRSVELTEGSSNDAQKIAENEPQASEDFNQNRLSSSRGQEPAWVKWVSRIISYLALTGLGLVVGYFFFVYKFGPVLETYQQIMQHPIEACQQLLQPYMSAGVPGEHNSPPIAPQQEKAPATKGDNGKHK
jgi:proteasome lid subunit RPN8/RPN11